MYLLAGCKPAKLAAWEAATAIVFWWCWWLFIVYLSLPELFPLPLPPPLPPPVAPGSKPRPAAAAPNGDPNSWLDAAAAAAAADESRPQ